LQVIGKLLENAFIKAILPGLDREIKATGRRVVRVPADQSGARSDDAGTPVERAQQRRERQGRKLLVVDHGLLLEPPGPKAQTSLFCARAAVGLQAGPL
jgi:hypothetical protein